MHENDNAPTRAGGYQRLGRIGDAEVGVQHSLRGQSILIQQGDAGRCLAGLLGITAPEIVEREGVPLVRIPHTDQVDDLLKQIVEALISIRYAHPTLVQLHLELPEPAPDLSTPPCQGTTPSGRVRPPGEAEGSP